MGLFLFYNLNLYIFVKNTKNCPVELRVSRGFFFFFFFMNLYVFVFLCVVMMQFMSMRRESGRVTLGELASKMSRLKVVGENLTEEERASFIHDFYPDHHDHDDVDFELFLRVSVLSNPELCGLDLSL